MNAQLLIGLVVILFLTFLLMTSSFILLILAYELASLSVRLLLSWATVALADATKALSLVVATWARFDEETQRHDSIPIAEDPSQQNSPPCNPTYLSTSEAGPNRTARVHSAMSLQADTSRSTPQVDTVLQDDSSRSVQAEPSAPRPPTPPPVYAAYAASPKFTPPAPTPPTTESARPFRPRPVHHLSDPLADLKSLWPDALVTFQVQGFVTTGNARVNYATMIHGGSQNRGAVVQHVARCDEPCDDA